MSTAVSQIRGELAGRVKFVPIVTVVYWLVMLATGTDLLNASLFAAAIGFGLASITVAGGIRTFPGLLNFVMILKFLLIGIFLKTITFQAADSGLRAPRTTAEVMAVGFFSLYIGTLILRHLHKIRGFVYGVYDSRMYLALTVVFSAACLGSSLVILFFQVSYATQLQGGLWGFAHQYQAAAAFCIVPAMYYAWSSGSKFYLSHPLVLTLLAAELAIGIASTTKQGVMEPVLCYLAMGFIRYGWTSKTVWGVVATGGFFYVSIVYPYSQYVRTHGGRDGTLQERLEAIQEVFFNVATDNDFRQSVDTEITSADTYLSKDNLQPFSRFAMVGEADRLIAATDATQSYSGWETITLGLKASVPSFLSSNRPDESGGNFLGHIAGDLSPDDFDTQVSYGYMANFYNAFGLYGVLFGVVIFVPIFFYVLRIWFVESELTFGPWGSSIWYIFLGLLFEHSVIEGPIANDIPVLAYMVALVALVYLSKLLSGFWTRRQLSA